MAYERMKTVAFTEDGIGSLPKNKSSVYRIKDKNGGNLFTGVASRGSVAARIKEHLPGGPFPITEGITVQIQQRKTLTSALKFASKIIANEAPRYNENGNP